MRTHIATRFVLPVLLLGALAGTAAAQNYPSRPVRLIVPYPPGGAYGSTPGLKNSHALTWIPKVKEVGLNKFLSDTIDERFDSNADPKLVQWFIEQAGSNDPAFIARFVTHMTTHDFMEDVVRIKCPTLIVAAGKEKIGHASAYDEMHKRIAGSKLKLFDTGAHNICDGYAERCVGDLLEFLDGVRAT